MSVERKEYTTSSTRDGKTVRTTNVELLAQRGPWEITKNLKPDGNTYDVSYKLEGVYYYQHLHGLKERDVAQLRVLFAMLDGIS